MKTILITGSSSGFGKLSVPLLLKQGHTVIAGLRGGQSRLASVFGEVLSQYPGRLLALDIHMEKPESIEAARQFIDSRFGGKLDVLINNAGYGLFGSLEDLEPAQLRAQMEVNFFGPALLARALLPALRLARGRVINISSIAGLHSFPFYGAYSASKFALEGLSEGLYYDLRPHGVQVCLIEPGGFRTNFSKGSKIFASGPADGSSPYHARTEALKRAVEQTSPRHGDPMRVARLIARYCDQTRIPLRRRIGVDAGALSFFNWLLPQRTGLYLTDLAFRLGVFRGAK
jgi:NAD(P)-dependent dehydrogenase (short-subunit alcohol dehydrogenase family)